MDDESAGCVSLLDLPHDALSRIVSHCAAADLVAGVAPACTLLRSVAGDQSLWEDLFRARYAPLLARLFGGEPPRAAAAEAGWRAFYYAFRRSWPALAAERGHVVLQLGDQYYDVTTYLDDHPGGPEYLSDAAGTDATGAFDAVGHSVRARELLRQFALPEELFSAADGEPPPPPPPPLDAGSWSSAASLVSDALHGREGRQRLRETAGSLLAAVWADLTEGRPDRRRVSPAVWQLAVARMRGGRSVRGAAPTGTDVN